MMTLAAMANLFFVVLMAVWFVQDRKRGWWFCVFMDVLVGALNLLAFASWAPA